MDEKTRRVLGIISLIIGLIFIASSWTNMTAFAILGGAGKGFTGSVIGIILLVLGFLLLKRK